MKLQQKGFAHLELIIVLVVVVIIGASGWFVYSNNKIDNSAGTVVPGTLPPKPDPVKPTTSSLSIDELGIKMQLNDGWTSAKTADLYGLNYTITSPSSPIAIKAFVSNSPSGFEGCGSDDNLASTNVTLYEQTAIPNVVVFGNSLSGISVASSNTRYGLPIKTQKATELRLSEMKVGSEYFICTGSHPPLSWSVDFDGKKDNQDGIYAYNTANVGTVVTKATAGYSDMLDMLKSISR